LISYGLSHHDAGTLLQVLALCLADIKAVVHYSPTSEVSKGFLAKDSEGRIIPTVFHLTSTQEDLHASLLPLTDPSALGYQLPTSSYPPVTVHVYPKVTLSAFLSTPPAFATADDSEPFIRSAKSLSLTRTLEILKRHIGPHFDFGKLWEKHSYYEFVERDASKTMSTMVASPYVNHVPSMTGGVGFKELSRFYKYHFTGVSPPDTELINVSRTIGADRLVDEMIFKCTHTTEIDYFLPGVAPTGKPLEIAIVGIVGFRGDKLCFEHLYWDQASALVQLGLLDKTNLPVSGVEQARKVLNPFGIPSNVLLADKWKASKGLSIE